MAQAIEAAQSPPADPVQLPLRPSQLVETSKHCRLLELPLELRISINESLLPIMQRLCIFSRSTRKDPEYVRGHYGLIGQAGVFRLAFTCHQIYDECMRILYGWFDFTTLSAVSLIHWLEDIGRMERYVRHISLSLDWTRFVPKALPRLQQVTSLRVLELNFRVRESASPASLARDLRLMLEGIAKSMREQGEGGSWERALDVVRFPERFASSDEAEAEDRVQSEVYAREFREETRKMLQ
ncbi:hypothetical protein LTR09_003155 [Extremus antarcticus]|uniref:Uncharacterized protein n=1 Tax=Extremus antarcticus TaxID=702011 RepID=A0AAJ0LUS0_9PEZI|nr:hypothetical protein LTR09_003155 [Extremus antarcticus]